MTNCILKNTIQKNHSHAMILLHEIYGINKFMNVQCQRYKNAGYDVYCPNIIQRASFAYEEASDAYDYFIRQIGFDVYKGINNFIYQLKKNYEDVYLLGFSVGATIAWRCCENASCSGIVACYGSRIRDYTQLNPACPTLLLFAKEDAFDLEALNGKLKNKKHLSLLAFDAAHGFMDCYSSHFNLSQSRYAQAHIDRFLFEQTKALL